MDFERKYHCCAKAKFLVYKKVVNLHVRISKYNLLRLLDQALRGCVEEHAYSYDFHSGFYRELLSYTVPIVVQFLRPNAISFYKAIKCFNFQHVHQDWWILFSKIQINANKCNSNSPMTTNYKQNKISRHNKKWKRPGPITLGLQIKYASKIY